MGYEYAEFMGVDDEGYVHDGLTEKSAIDLSKSWIDTCNLGDDGYSNGVEQIKLGIVTHQTSGADNDYELHPTAEWSRIQQALKELEMYQNGQADYEMVRDKRDELAAELERLPKTKDGKAIFLGDEVWFHDPDRSVFDPEGIVCEEVCSIYNGKGFEEYEGSFTICCDTYEAGNLEFYSSREECLKEVQEEQDQLIEGAEQEANRIRKEGE